MNTLRYLRRIGIEALQPATLAGLARLQEQHVLTVPFENLDIRRAVPIELETGALFDKVVVRRRGGFCYELNGLFCELLRALGYAVDLVSARVFSDSGDAGPEFDHMALIVTMGTERYLVDVGFGDSARHPIRLPNGEVEDISGRYRVRPREADSGCYVLERRVDDGWKPQFRFTDQPREIAEFAAMCTYHQTSPDSHFTQRNMITIATPTGRFTLTDSKVIETESGVRMETPVSSHEEYERTLAERFGIRF
ncbi:MAG: arylamine N-acetyltransferase [candidate division Zixibacteria bacterium]|jgi:N-hydroxyarylamine O-acetyltransferase|nr:arylamine N-acetyltransferase [candidate division Zixibacteria bacterium]